jgi:hypothetical protein
MANEIIQWLAEKMGREEELFPPFDETDMVLRRRLTKKEYKALKGLAMGLDMESIGREIKVDEERLERIVESISGKLAGGSVEKELFGTL